MKTPKYLKIISQMTEAIRTKTEEIINECLENDHLSSWPLEDFSTYDLEILSEYAKENDLVMTLRAEHSNLHQGVLVTFLKRELVNDFKEWL